jgi:hypothetical protein
LRPVSILSINEAASYAHCCNSVIGRIYIFPNSFMYLFDLVLMLFKLRSFLSNQGCLVLWINTVVESFWIENYQNFGLATLVLHFHHFINKELCQNAQWMQSGWLWVFSIAMSTLILKFGSAQWNDFWWILIFKYINIHKLTNRFLFYDCYILLDDC